MSDGGVGTTESYLRIAAISIYAYDMVITFGKHRRFLRMQMSWHQPSLICCLYFALIVTTCWFLTISQVAYFDRSFGDLCASWVHLLAASRVAASLLAKLIILWRTLKIWNNRYLGGFLWLVLLAQFGVALFSTTRAVPRSLPGLRNCIAAQGRTNVPAWNDFLLNVIFDGCCWAATVYKLVCNAGGTPWKTFSRFLLFQSSGYMAGQTALNVGNLVFYALPARLGLTTTLSSIGLSLGSILAQRMITGLHDFKAVHSSMTRALPTTALIGARTADSAQSVVFMRGIEVEEVNTWWRKDEEARQDAVVHHVTV